MDPAVRAAAAAGLRELADVLPTESALGVALRGKGASDDAVVRGTVIDLLRSTGFGVPGDFLPALRDTEIAVRIQAIRGLVRLDDALSIARAADDASREVRVAAAVGLGTVADPRGAAALLRLATDADPLVRAAALQAARAIGCPAPIDAEAVRALADPAWQVREGGARALGGAEPDLAIPALLGVLGDGNLDVRRAAVQSLAGWTDRGDVVIALRAALTDTDADVRAYARRALAAVTV